MTDEQFEKAKKLRSDISHEENNLMILKKMDMTKYMSFGEAGHGVPIPDTLKETFRLTLIGFYESMLNANMKEYEEL